MEPRKRTRKGQVAPEDGEGLVGSENLGFEMEEKSTKPNNLTASSMAQVVDQVREDANPFMVITNVQQKAMRWKNYVSTRRFKKRPAQSTQLSQNALRSNTGGVGLDELNEQYIDYSAQAFKIFGNEKKKNLDISMASNKALIQYFAKLGKSLQEDDSINLDFVHSLIQSGADINATDRHGQTVLHEVARSWHIDVAKFLIEHNADINKGDNYGRTPLHVASAVDYPEMVKLLVENGADKESLTKGEKQTPLFYAAKTDAVSSLKTLIDLGCLFKDVRDFKGRTPVHVAAELDRSETARFLLEKGAPVWMSDDFGAKPLTWMITKMPTVANEALKQFHLTDRPNRKQYFYLNYLVQDQEKDPSLKTQSPLQVAVNHRMHDLLLNDVFVRLLDVMWVKFGRFWALFNLGFNFMYILLWTVFGISVEYDERHLYKMPQDTWRIFLFILATLFTVYQIYDEIMEFIRSKRAHSAMEERRKEEIEMDKEYCHPQWPEEEKFLDSELVAMEKLAPKYFESGWNLFDWMCYLLLMICIATHITDVIKHSETIARLHIRFMTVTIIVLWLRLMKNARAFAWIGPFIVMLSHMIKDCLRFLFLYLEFYIPYLCAFWMIFGGTKKSQSGDSIIQVQGFELPGFTIFSMLRLTLVDDYDYDNMHAIDDIMTDLLLGTWFIFSSILCLNLFIALLSDTFQRVYDNAQANAVMQKAVTVLSIWEGMSEKSKYKFLHYILDVCSPLVDDYDDDVVTSDTDDLKKVTFQIKEDLEEFTEMFRNHFGVGSNRPFDSLLGRKNSMGGVGGGGGGSMKKLESDIVNLRGEVASIKARQEDFGKTLGKEMKNIKTMLSQISNSVNTEGSRSTQAAAPTDGSGEGSEMTPVSKLKRKPKKKTIVPQELDLEVLQEDITPVNKGRSPQDSRATVLSELPQVSPSDPADSYKEDTSC